MYLRPLLLTIVACSAPPHQTQVATTMETAACAAPRSFGAVPDDGVDDRVALQSTLTACAGSTVELEAGRYNVVTPPWPRARAMLAIPDGTRFQGQGDRTEILFTGDNMGAEWRGIQWGSRTTLRRVSLRSRLTRTVEQTHMMRGDGPLRDVEVDHVGCDHVAADGGKSGDCASMAGYPATATTPDRRLWNIHLHHNVVRDTGRAGFAFHSGVRSSRFDHNVFLHARGQYLDGEVGNGMSDNDSIEIDHNLFAARVGLESALAIQIQTASHIRIHDNVVSGAVDLYGCDACELADNEVTLSVETESAVVGLRKSGSGTVFRDEIYTRNASAGDGYVLAVVEKEGSPDHVVVTDTEIVQHAGEPAVYSWGIVGLALRHLTLTCDAAAQPYSAIALSGSPATRTTELELTDSAIVGPYTSAIAVGGSYAGTGSVDVQRNTSTRASAGLVCVGPGQGGRVTGPVTYVGNAMPAASCAPVP